jgi:hypothetical protein
MFGHAVEALMQIPYEQHVLVAHFSSGEPHSELLVHLWKSEQNPPVKQRPEPSAVSAQTQPLSSEPHAFQAPQREPAQLGTSGTAGGATQVPAVQESPEAQVLPQEPQLLVSLCRSLQVSGVVPQREEVGAEQGHVVAVTRAVSVSVDVGAMVRVVAGTVRDKVSVSSVMVVMSMTSVV